MNNRDLVKLLLSNGASTSEQDKHGRTVVEYIEDGSMVGMLVENSLFEGQACGRDLVCAISFCRVRLVRKLIESGVDANSRDSHERAVLLTASEHADDLFNIITDDINDRDEYGTYGSELMKLLKVLLEAGAKPCIPGHNLRTPATAYVHVLMSFLIFTRTTLD